MAEIDVKVIELIKEYLELLDQSGFAVRSAYLFGSYAHGQANEWSDIDLAVVSDSFEGNRFKDKEKIRGLYRKVDLRLSTLPMTQSDLLEDPFIYNEIYLKGIRIA